MTHARWSARNGVKPGCATQPMFGVQPGLLDEQGKEIEGAGSGVLAIKASWPAQIRSVYGDHATDGRHLLQALPRRTTSPATAHAATRTAITGSPAASTT